MDPDGVRLLVDRFVDAFNRRDPDAFVALMDPEVAFHPTVLVGDRGVYHGHDGVRRWFALLGASTLGHRVRIRGLHVLDDGRFLLLTEVIVGDEVVAPSAMAARLSAAGSIAEAHAYLSDEQMLEYVGFTLPPATRAAILGGGNQAAG